jgi:hypothetical protein
MILSKINFSETPSSGEIWEIRMQNTLSSSGYSPWPDDVPDDEGDLSRDLYALQT